MKYINIFFILKIIFCYSNCFINKILFKEESKKSNEILQEVNTFIETTTNLLSNIQSLHDEMIKIITSYFALLENKNNYNKTFDNIIILFEDYKKTKEITNNIINEGHKLIKKIDALDIIFKKKNEYYRPLESIIVKCEHIKRTQKIDISLIFSKSYDHGIINIITFLILKTNLFIENID